MRRRRERSEQVSGGLVLVLIGIGAWAVQSGSMEFLEVLSYWPVLVLIHGIEKVMAGRFAWGFFSLALGAVLFVEEWRYFIVHDGWPLLLILMGLVMTLEAFRPRKTTVARGDGG